MKKICCVLWILLLSAALFLPCNATYAMSMSECDHYSSYLSFVAWHEDEINHTNAPFVHYRQIASLGAFRQFSCPASSQNRAADFYTYMMPNELKLNILPDCYAHWQLGDLINPHTVARIPHGKNDVQTVHICDIADPQHMVLASRPSTATYATKENELPSETVYVLTVGKLQYHYAEWYKLNTETAPLQMITWEHDGNTYVLTGNGLNSFPAGQDTLMGRLLNAETAEAALEELIADIDGDYEMPTEDWHLIGQYIISPVILISAAVLPIVIVKRKKKKAALAGGGDKAPDADITDGTDISGGADNTGDDPNTPGGADAGNTDTGGTSTPDSAE